VRIAVDDDHVLDGRQRAAAQKLEEAALGHDRSRARVVHQVLDVGRRRGLIERERRGAGRRRGEVRHPEFGAIRDKQRHAIAAPHAERSQPARGRADAFGEVVPGEDTCIVERADGDTVAAARDGVEAQEADGPRRGRAERRGGHGRDAPTWSRRAHRGTHHDLFAASYGEVAGRVSRA
jgi:hypothetical protein